VDAAEVGDILEPRPGALERAARGGDEVVERGRIEPPLQAPSQLVDLGSPTRAEADALAAPPVC